MSRSFPSLLKFRVTPLYTSRPTFFTRRRHVVFHDAIFLTFGHRQKQDRSQFMDFLVLIGIGLSTLSSVELPLPVGICSEKTRIVHS